MVKFFERIPALYVDDGKLVDLYARKSSLVVKKSYFFFFAGRAIQPMIRKVSIRLIFMLTI